MVLDPELLERARAASAQFAEAERQALLSRAEYHTAVRRLHLGGGSLREIAQTLALSHQRVQQIVSGAGGSWWRRVWRTRTVRPDAVCTWCGRPPSEVSKLIAGPRVYICDACVEAAEHAATSGGATAGPFTQANKRSLLARCAFCGRRASQARSLVSASASTAARTERPSTGAQGALSIVERRAPGSRAGHVCTDCLRVCREILEGRAA